MKRANILGIGISPINMQTALKTIEGWISCIEQHYICVTPIHGIMDAYKDPELVRIFNQSGLTTPDGMGVVWLLRLLGYRDVSRVYGPDLMQTVCQASVPKGWQHFFYGGAPGVADTLAQELQARFPGLLVAGTYTPPFRPLTPEEDHAVIEAINRSGAQIVWVGISTPKQERWMAAHSGKINAPVMAGVGAAFDFLSGRKKQAPHWIQRSGLEWLYRLGSEPSRLWRRYIKYPLFGLLILGQLLGLRKYGSVPGRQEA